jgi:polysaccharide chain length determinant protein (PEP-CTERM system associated)
MNQPFDPSHIVSSLYRRRDLIIAVALVVMALAAYLAVTLADVYRSSTLILVTPQSLPAQYVSSTVTTTIEQRMQAIAQQILGRTMLEKVVNEFNLFSGDKFQISTDARVAMLRQRMALTINRNNTFTISFDSESPQMARLVTARIASLFIEENLRVREQQATGTTSFINAEAERLRKELEEQEQRVNKFRAQYWHELPENREANARSLEQLRRELDNGTIRLSTLQDRKTALEKQLAEAELFERQLGKIDAVRAGATGTLSHYDRKKELESLLAKYSDKHPDVVRLRRDLENAPLEKPVEAAKKSEPDRTLAGKSPLMMTLVGQLREVNTEMLSLHSQNSNLRSQMALLQARIDNTSIRAIELSKITRDYDITLKKYQDLLAKGLESELAENMERKQKGEQFQIVDPANTPQHPVAPNRPRILILGILLGIGGGVGAAVLLDMLDKSFKSQEDLTGYTNIPVLAVLPAIVTRGSILAQRQARTIVIVTSFGVLVLGVILVRYLGALLPLG